jgi:hypothetical protein
VNKYREDYRMKKSVGILLALLLVVLCFGAAGEAEVSSDAVTLTITPKTNLLLYQDVTYNVYAKGATNAALVFVDGEYEDEMYLDEYIEPDEYGNWFLPWSTYYRGEIGVYPKASFDNGATWISGEMQILDFKVKGEASFGAAADADVVTRGEPIVIRFSGVDGTFRIASPTVYKVMEDEEIIDLPDFRDFTMTQREMTCETENLEAGSYLFEFFSMPAELGYAEYQVIVEVTITE